MRNLSSPTPTVLMKPIRCNKQYYGAIPQFDLAVNWSES